MVEGTSVTVLMTATTIFALFGDDFRLWLTTKEADPYFFVGLVISFILFGLELLIQSCVVDEFKYSFFFWLDFIATLSVVLDIPWFTDYLSILFDIPESKYSMDVVPGVIVTDRGTSTVGKILKSFRLIRLIRIIKLYNYAVKSNAAVEEAKQRDLQKMSTNA